MTPVFADTSYWVALTNPWDEYAEEAQHFDVLLSAGNVCTTEEVLNEVLKFSEADRWLRMRAVATVKEILSDEAVTVIPQTHGSFLAGVDFYAKRPDKGYSLTDCISMQTMYR